MSEANEVDGGVMRLKKASSGIDECGVQDPETGSLGGRSTGYL